MHSAQLARFCGCEQDPRVLVLNTPTWAAPEATQASVYVAVHIASGNILAHLIGCSQEVNLLRSLVAEGMTPTAAIAYLDSCPPISFSVWCYCGAEQPSSWHRGYAVVVLDNGRDSGTGEPLFFALSHDRRDCRMINKSCTIAGWQGVRLGSTMSTSESLAYWISWAPENSLLRGCSMLAKRYIATERGEYRKLSCVFRGYREVGSMFQHMPSLHCMCNIDFPSHSLPSILQGVRRAHILLKGLNPKNVYPRNGKEIRPSTEFIAPCLRFVMPDA